jgi:hypothetical protein
MMSATISAYKDVVFIITSVVTVYHQLFVGELLCYLCYLYLYSSSKYSSVQYDLIICVTWRVSY